MNVPWWGCKEKQTRIQILREEWAQGHVKGYTDREEWWVRKYPFTAQLLYGLNDTVASIPACVMTTSQQISQHGKPYEHTQHLQGSAARRWIHASRSTDLLPNRISSGRRELYDTRLAPQSADWLQSIQCWRTNRLSRDIIDGWPGNYVKPLPEWSPLKVMRLLVGIVYWQVHWKRVNRVWRSQECFAIGRPIWA